MADADAERAAIQAAIKRLLDGTPQRSTGALSVLQLATEAGVKRWVLTHKHTDLAEEFRNRAAALGPVPVAFSHLEQRLHTAEETVTRLRAQNRELAAQVSAYARVIHELRTQGDAVGLAQAPLSLVPAPVSSRE